MLYKVHHGWCGVNSVKWRGSIVQVLWGCGETSELISWLQKQIICGLKMGIGVLL